MVSCLRGLRGIKEAGQVCKGGKSRRITVPWGYSILRRGRLKAPADWFPEATTPRTCNLNLLPISKRIRLLRRTITATHRTTLVLLPQIMSTHPQGFDATRRPRTDHGKQLCRLSVVAPRSHPGRRNCLLKCKPK